MPSRLGWVLCQPPHPSTTSSVSPSPQPMSWCFFLFSIFSSSFSFFSFLHCNPYFVFPSLICPYCSSNFTSPLPIHSSLLFFLLLFPSPFFACTSLCSLLGTLPYDIKIVIAGNHELTFDQEFMADLIKQDFYYFPSASKLKPENYENVQSLLTNCIYLQDSEVTVRGFRIYGSPWWVTTITALHTKGTTLHCWYWKRTWFCNIIVTSFCKSNMLWSILHNFPLCLHRTFPTSDNNQVLKTIHLKGQNVQTVSCCNASFDAHTAHTRHAIQTDALWQWYISLHIKKLPPVLLRYCMCLPFYDTSMCCPFWAYLSGVILVTPCWAVLLMTNCRRAFSRF